MTAHRPGAGSFLHRQPSSATAAGLHAPGEPLDCVRPRYISSASEKYDEALRKHESAGVEFPPDGMAHHVCFGSNGTLAVSEIWDSREQFEAYGERLMPMLKEVGIEFLGEPEILEVRNIVNR